MSNNELPAVLWIGDLQSHMTESYLNNLFKSCHGYLKSKVILNKNPSAKANYGFLFFKEHEDARSVIMTLNGKLIPGTTIKYSLNWGSVGPSIRTANDVTIYVGDLSYETTDTQLLNFFKKRYPSVVAARINMDTCTHVSRGYAFVRFTNPVEAEHALENMTGEMLLGSPIRVARAINRQATNSKSPQPSWNALYDNTQRLKQIYNHQGDQSPPMQSPLPLLSPMSPSPQIQPNYNSYLYQSYLTYYQQYLSQLAAYGQTFPPNYAQQLALSAMQQLPNNYGNMNQLSPPNIQLPPDQQMGGGLLQGNQLQHMPNQNNFQANQIQQPFEQPFMQGHMNPNNLPPSHQKPYQLPPGQDLPRQYPPPQYPPNAYPHMMDQSGPLNPNFRNHMYQNDKSREFLEREERERDRERFTAMIERNDWPNDRYMTKERDRFDQERYDPHLNRDFNDIHHMNHLHMDSRNLMGYLLNELDSESYINLYPVFKPATLLTLVS